MADKPKDYDDLSDQTKTFIEAFIETDDNEPKREWTDAQKQAAERMVERYEAHCEMYWEERVQYLATELEMSYEDADELAGDYR